MSVEVTNQYSASPERQPLRDVLLVDSCSLTRLGLHEILERHFHPQKIHETDDAVCAAHTIANNPVNIVITEIFAKRGSVLNLINDFYRQSRVLVLSRFDGLYAGSAELAFRAGAHGYVSKDAPVEQITEAIADIFAGQMYADKSVSKRILRSVWGKDKSINEYGIDALSGRELEVFDLIGRGFTTNKIANHLFLSPKTIETYRENIKSKLVLDNATELNAFAIRWRLPGRTQ